MSPYFDALRRTFDFTGRSTRSQYWLFWLVLFALLFVVLMIEDYATGGGVRSPTGETVYVFGGLVGLLHILPSLSLSVRRLHDTDRSGWWVLITLVPLVGGLVLLVLTCLPSNPGPNRFGPPVNPQKTLPEPNYGAAAGLDHRANASSGHALGPTAAEPAPAATGAPIEQLERLATLRADGTITEEEFRGMKAKLLARSTGAGA